MSTIEPPLPPKKDVCLALLEGPSVFVHLDPRKEGVAVPNWFKKQPNLTLQIGLNMPVPIPDLEVTDEGITCTLSFSRSPFWCKLPWSAVYALMGEDGRGMVWREDLPPELEAQTRPAEAQKKPTLTDASAPASSKTTSRSSGKPALRSVPPPPPLVEVASTADESADADQASPAAEAATEAKPAVAPAPVAAISDQTPDTTADSEDATPAPAEAEESKPTSPSDGGGKKQLPPYLRVIK